MRCYPLPRGIFFLGGGWLSYWWSSRRKWVHLNSLSLTLPRYSRAGAQNYIDTHQRYAGGKYVYTLEQFGLSRDEIRTAFDRYCQTHGV